MKPIKLFALMSLMLLVVAAGCSDDGEHHCDVTPLDRLHDATASALGFDPI